MNQTTQKRLLAGGKFLSKGGLIAVAVFVSSSIAGMGIANAGLITGMALLAAAGRDFWRASTFNRAAFLLILLHLGTAVYSPSTLGVFDAARSFWAFALMTAVINFRKRYEKTEPFLEIALVCAAIISIYAIAQHYLGLDILRVSGKTKVFPAPDGRFLSIGFFDHHLTFGNSMLVLWCLNLGYLSGLRGKRTALFVATLALITTAVAFSYARGAYMGMFAGFAVLVLSLDRKVLKWLVPAAAAAAIALLALSAGLRGRIASIFDWEHNLDRIMIWKTTMQMIADHPWRGVGFGNFRESITPYQQALPGMLTSQAHAHNVLLQNWAAGGVAYLGLIVWFFTRLVLGARQNVRITRAGSPLERGIRIGALAAVVGFITAGMFQNNFGDGENLFALCLALGYAAPLDSEVTEYEFKTV